MEKTGQPHPGTPEDDSQQRLFKSVNCAGLYDADYLKSLRLKAMVWLNNVDADDWIRDLRGGYDS